MTVPRRNRLASIMRRAHEAARRMRARFETYRAALAFALRNVYRAEARLEAIFNKRGAFMYARFVKKDGTIREMQFTYGWKQKQHDEAAGAPANLVTVLDMKTREYRRINLDTLAEVRPAKGDEGLYDTPEEAEAARIRSAGISAYLRAEPTKGHEAAALAMQAARTTTPEPVAEALEAEPAEDRPATPPRRSGYFRDGMSVAEMQAELAELF